MTVKYQPNFWNLARKQVSYLAHANNKSHDHIDVFNPDVKTLRDSYQDFLFKIKQFDGEMAIKILTNLFRTKQSITQMMVMV